jgi:hypothetical protein
MIPYNEVPPKITLSSTKTQGIKYVACSGFIPDKAHSIFGILYIKNIPNESPSIAVVLEAIQNTCNRVMPYLNCSCCALVF